MSSLLLRPIVRLLIRCIRFLSLVCQRAVERPGVLPLLVEHCLDDPDDDATRALVVRCLIQDEDSSPGTQRLCELERDRNPANLDVRAFLAGQLLRRQDIRGALSACEDLLNVDPGHMPTHRVIVRAYARMGKLAQLRDLYRDVLEKDPRNASVRTMLGLLKVPPEERERDGWRESWCKIPAARQQALFDLVNRGPTWTARAS